MPERLSEIASRIACRLETASQNLPIEKQLAAAQAWLAIEIYRALVAERNASLEDAASLCDRRVKDCENVPEQYAIPMQAEAQCLAQEIRDLKQQEVLAQASS